MYFTEEDFKKIEEWLLKKAMKDSRLPAVKSLGGSELIPIVQGGFNKVVPLYYFRDRISEMNIPEFINVSARYRKYHIGLHEAINLVPCASRKPGAVITFLNKECVWCVMQFKGELVDNWENLHLWGDLFGNYVDVHMYYPDGEDLEGFKEGGKHYIKLKDREYDKKWGTGKGRKIIRKTPTEVSDCCSEDEEFYENIISQKDFDQPNTVYVIRYDFVVEDAIVIPDNCEIVFEGGSISNGTISLNGCKLLGIVGNIEDYFIDSHLYGFAEGQLNYKDGHMEYWDGSQWKSL